MFLFFIVCIQLSILHVCVSDLGYSCTNGLSNDPIYLVDSFEGNHTINRLNEKFIEKCHEFYTIYTSNVDMETAINGWLVGDIKYRNHIVLSVTNKVLKDMNESQINDLYAGNISDTAKPFICVKNYTTEEYKCNETMVKLVTKSINQINSGDLFDFITKIEIINNEIHTRDTCYSVIETNEELKTVLLCLSTDIDQSNIAVNIEPLKLIITNTYMCQSYINKFNYNFLAVLAPEPLKELIKIESELSIPTIFYESPYILPEYETMFPNSMTLFSLNMLKYAFVEFLKRNGWNRAVVLSDESVHSIEFESELTELLSAERIAYTVIRCEDATFNTTKAILSLNDVGARIVIANMEIRNLHSIISRLQSGIVWLVRHSTVSSEKRYIFSFTLGPAVQHSKYCNLNDKILEGLSNIVQAYKKMTYKDFALNKLQFYSNFRKAMKNTRTSDAIAYVNEIQSQGSKKYVSEMHIDASGVKRINFDDPFKHITRPLDASPCIVRNNNYKDPCDDNLVLFFMFVIIMFLTTSLLITCFFDKTSPFHDIRYQQF